LRGKRVGFLLGREEKKKGRVDQVWGEKKKRKPENRFFSFRTPSAVCLEQGGKGGSKMCKGKKKKEAQ